jgi:hypothetical protein
VGCSHRVLDGWELAGVSACQAGRGMAIDRTIAPRLPQEGVVADSCRDRHGPVTREKAARAERQVKQTAADCLHGLATRQVIADGDGCRPAGEAQSQLADNPHNPPACRHSPAALPETSAVVIPSPTH